MKNTKYQVNAMKKGRNQMPYNKFLINLVCLVCTRKCFPESFFRTDLATSSLDLYQSVRIIHSRADLIIGLISNRYFLNWIATLDCSPLTSHQLRVWLFRLSARLQ